MRYMIKNAFVVEIVHCKVKFFSHFGLSNYLRCSWCKNFDKM